MNGLVAFIVPGRDRYSRAQGTRSKTPGGIEAGTTAVLTRTLDRFLPGPLPLSATAATILNEFAAQVDPASRNGTFASPFANLSFAKKAQCLSDDREPSGRERGLDPLPRRQPAGSRRVPCVFRSRRLRCEQTSLARAPLGWRLTRYAGVADGHKELKGYWQGRKAADPVRDVIVVGAGGGGPVVAKELAARGLDVLLLEAGPASSDSEREWSHFENEANNPATGVFRFGPGDRTQAAVGARPAAELLPLADRRRRRLDRCTTSATRRARCRAPSPTTRDRRR